MSLDSISPFHKKTTPIFDAVRYAEPDEAIQILLIYSDELYDVTSQYDYEIEFERHLCGITIHTHSRDFYKRASEYFTQMFGPKIHERIDNSNRYEASWSTDGLYEEYIKVSSDCNKAYSDAIKLEGDYNHISHHSWYVTKKEIDDAWKKWNKLNAIKDSYPYSPYSASSPYSYKV